ncbi:MAG: helix-turn-helix domain-containing protein [Leptolyngbya sp. SIO1D8]|nr:helix-turn-helix domain-containing protein [Leptolyngbya sp. SIO1D8]
MSPAQQEQLLSIGAYLQNIRNERGMAVDEIANQIFIRPALLRAIETGDWKTLPEPIFVHGFIRRYADYLGLDGQEVAKQFEPTPVSVLPDPQLASTKGVEGVVNQQDKHGLKVLSKADLQDLSSTPVRPEAVTTGGRKWLLGLGAIALLMGGIWLITQRSPQTANVPNTSEESVSSETTPNEDETASVESATGTDVSATDPDEVAAETSETVIDAPSSAGPITLQVSLEEDSWMRVIVDGEEVYEGTLPRGTQESWTAENELTLRAGNSGAVLYSFNGGDEARLGTPGTVSNLTLTPTTDPQALPSQ